MSSSVIQTDLTYLKDRLKNCSRNIPIGCALVTTCTIVIICFIISLFLLVVGYNPRVLTESQYKLVTANVIGYGQENVNCYYKCNCRRVCRPSKPNCKNSWEKQTICDTCSNPCINAWVIYSVMPPGPSYVFNAFNKIDSNSPIPYLKETYPFNSTISAYYYTMTSDSGTIFEYVVYGDKMNTSINCFIAGFFFVGLASLAILVYISLLIFYCLWGRN